MASGRTLEGCEVVTNMLKVPSFFLCQANLENNSCEPAISRSLLGLWGIIVAPWLVSFFI